MRALYCEFRRSLEVVSVASGSPVGESDNNLFCSRNEVSLGTGIYPDAVISIEGMKLKIRIGVLVAMIGFLGFLGAGRASAQEFNCASQNMRRNYCSLPDARARVELVKQNSDNPCIRGETWGNDGRGIWVDRGCRGTFRVTRWSGGGPDGPPWWNSGGRPPQGPKNGACFFRDPGFRGDYFCQARGTQGGRVQLNNDISSIQISGHTTVTFYEQPNFSGASATTRRSIDDLKQFRLPNGSTWNNRISSVVVN